MTRIFLLVVAAGFFLLGIVFLPFGISASKAQGANPVLGWVIYLSSVAIPWGIAYLLLKLARRDASKPE